MPYSFIGREAYVTAGAALLLAICHDRGALMLLPGLIDLLSMRGYAILIAGSEAALATLQYRFTKIDLMRKLL